MNTEIIWAAGFFDGEGSTYRVKSRGRPYGRIRLSIKQKDPRPLKRFRRAVGDIGRLTWRDTIHGGIWALDCEDRAAKTIMQLLMPHLSEPKREQWKRVLEKNKAHPVE